MFSLIMLVVIHIQSTAFDILQSLLHVRKLYVFFIQVSLNRKGGFMTVPLDVNYVRKLRVSFCYLADL